MGDFWGNFIQQEWPLFCFFLAIFVGVIIEWKRIAKFFRSMSHTVDLTLRIDALNEQLAQSESARRAGRRVIDDMLKSLDHMAEQLHGHRTTIQQLQAEMDARAENERNLWADVIALLEWNVLATGLAFQRGYAHDLPPRPQLCGVQPADDGTSDDTEVSSFSEGS